MRKRKRGWNSVRSFIKAFKAAKPAAGAITVREKEPHTVGLPSHSIDPNTIPGAIPITSRSGSCLTVRAFILSILFFPILFVKENRSEPLLELPAKL